MCCWYTSSANGKNYAARVSLAPPPLAAIAQRGRRQPQARCVRWGIIVWVEPVPNKPVLRGPTRQALVLVTCALVKNVKQESILLIKGCRRRICAWPAHQANTLPPSVPVTRPHAKPVALENICQLRAAVKKLTASRVNQALLRRKQGRLHRSRASRLQQCLRDHIKGLW